MSIFSDAQQLDQWLQTRGIDTSTWGTGTAKTVHDLWVEIVAGESVLVEEWPWRQVSVVELLVLRHDQVLFEAAQTLDGGRVRQRNRLPAEKMKPDEDLMSAIGRWLAEELQIDDARQGQLLDQPITTRRSTEESKSFPGLVTAFTFFRVALTVTGLPEGEFSLLNAAHAFGDPVVSHLWRWVSLTEFRNSECQQAANRPKKDDANDTATYWRFLRND